MSSLLHAAEQLEAEAAQERVSYLDGLGVLAPSVLDVGCGNGYSVLEMQARGMKAVGVDRSLYRLSRWVAEGSVGRQLVIADAAALPFTTAQFNTVTASGMLEHIGVSEHSAPYRVSPLPNKGQARATAVAELRRVTSGVLVLDFPNGWFPIDFWHGDSLGAFRVHRVPDSLNPSLRELRSYLPGARLTVLPLRNRLRFRQVSRKRWGRLLTPVIRRAVQVLDRLPRRLSSLLGVLYPFLVIGVEPAVSSSSFQRDLPRYQEYPDWW